MVSDLISSPLQIRRNKQGWGGGFRIQHIDYNQVLARQEGKRTAPQKAERGSQEYSTPKSPKGTTELHIGH